VKSIFTSKNNEKYMEFYLYLRLKQHVLLSFETDFTLFSGGKSDLFIHLFIYFGGMQRLIGTSKHRKSDIRRIDFVSSGFVFPPSPEAPFSVPKRS